MKTALDLPFWRLNKHEKKINANVREHGWFCTSVFADGDGVDFSYTTGFWLNLRQPELIAFSLPGESAHGIFWDIYRRFEDGTPLPIGVRTPNVAGGGDPMFFPVATRFYDVYPLSSRWFYRGDEFECLQMVWPDPAGLMPWESGHDLRFANSQPDLSENGWTKHLKS